MFERQYYGGNTYFMSRILLRLGNTIWVQDMRLLERLEMTNTTVTLMNVKKEILDKQFANFNEKPLSKLYELCKKCDIQLPNYNRDISKLSIVESFKQVPAQWAFLELNQCNEVYFSAASNPNQFFVRLFKFSDL